MKFSEKVTLLRAQQHLSQEEFAQLMGVSRQTISKWETGISYPEIEKLIFISNYFRVSLDYLLKDSTANTLAGATMDRLVLEFLGSSQDVQGIALKLVTIMRDGIISKEELVQMHAILPELEAVEKNIVELKKRISDNT